MDLTESLLTLSTDIYFLYDSMDRTCTIYNMDTARIQGLEKFSPVYSSRNWENFPGEYAGLDDQAVRRTSWPFTRTDGMVRTLEVLEKIYRRHPDGSPWQVIGTVRDISDLKTLEGREQQLRTLLMSLQEGLVQHDSSGAIVFANPSAQEILGLSLDQMRGRTSTDPRWQAVREDGSPFPGEEHPAMVSLKSGRDQTNVIMGVRKPDGKQTWISINSKALTGPPTSGTGEREILGAVASFFDITVRKNERILKETALRMREFARDHSRDELIRWFVDQGEKLTGSTIAFYQDLKTGPGGQTSHWSSNTEIHVCAAEPGEKHLPLERAGVWAQAVREGRPVIHNDFTVFQNLPALPSGHPPLFRELLVPVWDGNTAIGLLGVGNKRTDYVEPDAEMLVTLSSSLVQLLKEIRAQDMLLKMQAGLESSVNGYAFAEMDGSISYVNPAFLKLWGYSSTAQVYGRKASSFWKDPQVAAEVEKTVREKGFWQGELTAETSDGKEKIFETWSQVIFNKEYQPLGLMATFSDVTEHRKFQEASQQLERLESLGTLAGGIAHDFNNLMGGIYGCIDMATVTQDQELQLSYLSQALNTMGRAKELTRQLLTFSKGGEPRRRESDLAELVKNVIEFTLTGTGVTLEFLEDAKDTRCLIDESLMTQVIRNLTANALQAMKGAGILTVHLRKEPPEKGGELVLELQDQGEGIAPENLGRIFDPFFTTRETGNGLGLSTCYSIVKKHGGTIEAFSELGEGTTMVIRLPGLSETVQKDLPKETGSPSQKGRILILDDEPMLLQVCGAMVRELGYTVQTASTCREALDLWKREMQGSNPFRSAILDLTLPGEAGGVDTGRQIKALSPEAVLLVSSGYSGDPVLARPEEYGFAASLHKPFTLAELAEVLSKTVSP